MNSPKWIVPLFDLNYDDREFLAVESVLKSRWLTCGEQTAAFENEFADYMGAARAVAVSSGTAALHLLLLGSGIGPGDEVIVPSMTFAATVNAVLYVGATPVFGEIESLHRPFLDPKSALRLITPKTRAILVVHYAGYPANMQRFQEIADEHGLLLFEDAAHAPGAEIDGKRIGAWGNGAAFSFYSNKNLSTGEGGMVTTNDEALAQAVRSARSHGMTSSSWERHSGRAGSYDIERIGFNYRMTEIAAALGRVQLSKLDKANEKRATLVSEFHRLLSGIPGIALPLIHPRDSGGENAKSTHHIFPVLLSEAEIRDAFRMGLADAGIQTSLHYPPVHKMRYSKEYFSDSKRVALIVTEEYSERECTLPLFPTMTSDQVDCVVYAIRKTLSALGRGGKETGTYGSNTGCR